MVTLEDARRVIAAAEKKAAEIGQPMNVAVADAGGNLMPGSAALISQSRKPTPHALLILLLKIWLSIRNRAGNSSGFTLPTMAAS
jgi:acetyl esterase/lipase